MKALIVGASGYNGGNVIQQLVRDGHDVRGLVRSPHRANPALHEVVQGDVLAGTGLDAALDGVDVAFYFIHALDTTDGRADQHDVTAARHFVAAARRALLPRTVFFTVFAPPVGVPVPVYQRNRLNVEQIMLDQLAGVTSLRAGIVAGAGSRGIAPYIRAVERFPVLPLGPWRRNRTAVVDPHSATKAMIAAGTRDHLAGKIVDAPSSAEPTHEQLLLRIAHHLGLQRRVLPLPASPRILDAAFLATAAGETYTFGQYLRSVANHDYLGDPRHSEGLDDIRPLDLDTTLRTALTNSPAGQLVPQ